LFKLKFAITAGKHDNCVFIADINDLASAYFLFLAKIAIRELWTRRCALAPRAGLRGALGTGGKRSEHVLAGNDANQSMVAVDRGNAPDPVLDHELQHPRQSGIGADVNVRRRHDIGDGSVHQIIIPRHHLARREGKALQQVKLCHKPDYLRVLLDRIGIEIVALKHLVQLAYRHFARHGLDGARHVIGDSLLEKSVQGAIQSIFVCDTTSSATATRNARFE
jgi:hypothetical protein